jgi:hypothetical protein
LTKPAFKVDENLPREVANLLREHGYDAATVHEQAARRSSRLRHRKDMQSGEPRAGHPGSRFLQHPRISPAEHPGIVVLRTDHHDKQTVLALVSRVLPVLAKEPVHGVLWIVEPDRMRIWRSWD